MSYAQTEITILGPMDAADAPTVTPQGDPGVVSYGYAIVARGLSGHQAAGPEGTTATGNATLDETNYNTVEWTAVDGATGYDVYRTTGGATQGLIATVGADVLTLDDTGLVGDGADAPDTDTSGGPAMSVAGLSEKTLHIHGTFAATLQVQGGIAPDEFVDIGSAIAAPTLREISEQVAFVRVVMTAYTSGEPKAILAGKR